MQRVGLGRVSLSSIFLLLGVDYCNVVLQVAPVAITDLALPIYLCSSERLIELLREFPSDEPTRKRFIQEIIGWSAKFGPLERGDADLHHAVGSVYAEGK